jgi:hypothetical protein
MVWIWLECVGSLVFSVVVLGDVVEPLRAEALWEVH